MSGYTKGPWVRTHDHPDPETREQMASIRGVKNEWGFEFDIASVFCCHDEEQRANANLIAAAPELLEALEEAIQELREVTEELIGEDYNSPKFNAVIAKAKGESQ